MKTSSNISLLLFLALAPAALHAQSNLVANGSFELGLASWQLLDGSTMAITHSSQGVPEGSNFVIGKVGLFQDVPTVAGRDYILQLACWAPLPRVVWGGVPVTTFTTNPLAGLSSWRQAQCPVQAPGDLTRLRFESPVVLLTNRDGSPSNWVQSIAVDNVRLGWLQEPPSVQAQPQSQQVAEGAPVTFSVGALGGPPLAWQWRLDEGDIPGATNEVFQISMVRTNQAGAYTVLVSNPYGNVLSQAATLTVDPSVTSPTILAQPASQVLAAGYGCSVRVLAVGAAPLQYQWFLNGVAVSGATNPTYAIVALGTANSGTYTVVVSNWLAATLSLPAQITATNAAGGGWLFVQTNPPPRVYDVDGVTKLAGSAYAAQLYMGDSPDGLRPAGSVTAFGTGSAAGLASFYLYNWVAVPNVPAGGTAWVQLRAWARPWGATYEEARAVGGKFGFSALTSGKTRANQFGMDPIFTLPNFHLQAGLPFFSNGVLTVGNPLPDGTVQFILQGAAGFRYLIEKQLPPNLWSPFLIVTNVTGSVTFTDPQQAQANMGLYRARILD